MGEIQLAESTKELEPLGFQRLDALTGTSFRPAETAIIIPTRGTSIHLRFHQALVNLMAPPNQARWCLFACGQEVGDAYNNMVAAVLNDPQMSKAKYILTIEDDNLPPPDGHIRLIEAIESHGGFDAVGGLYWTKGDYQMPMAYGDPEDFRRTGRVDMRPLNVVEAVRNGWLLPCNGLGMGFTLWRTSLFREIPPPWFVTVAEWSPTTGAVGFTQDLAFCTKATLAGKRLACDARVKVGHLDKETGIVY